MPSSAPASFAIKNRGTGGVVITKVLPRPAGLDSQNEEVTFLNRGPLAVPMAGWVLRDASGKTWNLGSLDTLDPGASGRVQRRGMALNLNDDGDSLSLIAPDGTVVDSFSYGSSQEGVGIETGH
jgi:lamin tail-like protein